MKIAILNTDQGCCLAGVYPDDKDSNLILDEVFSHNGSFLCSIDEGNIRKVKGITYKIYGTVQLFTDITEAGLLRNPLYF